MPEPLWMESKAILALHDAQLAQHGGLGGVRDLNLLESALAKPQMAWAYEHPAPGLAMLAALYITGIARNPPFNDANKRTSWVTGRAFLYLNSFDLNYDRVEALLLMVRVAEGSADADEVAAWLTQGLRGR